MKKFMVLALFMYLAACRSPEDKATGDPDSSNFNHQAKPNLNTATDFDKKSTDSPDTSSAPASMKQNANSPTNGTNRGYGTGKDSGRQK
jgi:hypothetical protein